MNPIADLEALLTTLHRPDTPPGPQLRAIIAEIKKRDEAVRKVAEYLETYKFENPGSDVPGRELAARLREALDDSKAQPSSPSPSPEEPSQP